VCAYASPPAALCLVRTTTARVRRFGPTLTGRAAFPDDLITRCREQLAQGALGELARAVVFCVLSQRLPLASADAEVLTALVAETGGDRSALSEVEIDDSETVIWYFTDEIPGTDGDFGEGEAQDASAANGELDQAMAEALADEADAIGCWRAWRVPGRRYGPGRRYAAGHGQGRLRRRGRV